MLKVGQRVKLVGRRWFYYCGLKRIEMVGRVVTILSVNGENANFMTDGETFTITPIWGEGYEVEVVD